jgi:parvulin-like peptidyl-prolyl isomerase
MKRIALITLALAAIVVAVAGCSNVEDKVIIRLVDHNGELEPREVTVGYVNERLDRMPPHLLPTDGGEQAKRDFLEEIIRKELLVVRGLRNGALEDERLSGALEYFRNSKAEEMLREKLVLGPARPDEAYIQRFYGARDAMMQVQEIVVPSKDMADEAYRRVTEGGENFGRVAAEVSTASNARDEGRRPVTAWQDFHPLARVVLMDMQTGDICEPFVIGDTWYIYKINSRKDSPTKQALEGQFRNIIEVEALGFRRSILEFEVYEMWNEKADAVYNDEAVAVFGEALDRKRAELIPDSAADLPFEERLEIAKVKVVPDLTEEQQEMELVSYSIGGERITMTLGDLAALLEETPGMEGIKAGTDRAIRAFLTRKIQTESVQHAIDEEGYRESDEMAEYLAERQEEFIVDITYDSEVAQQVEDPTGQEIRDYFRSHREDFVEPRSVDLRQILVGSEDQANLIRQRLVEGEITFEEAVEKYSIDEWSKAKGGLIQKYYQGEKRLDYLQGVVFGLEPGEISEPFRAPGGYAIVTVVATHPERQMEFSEVSDVVIQSLTAIRREERLKALLDEVRETVTVEIVEENLPYVDDPAEVRAEKEANKVTVSAPLN